VPTFRNALRVAVKQDGHNTHGSLPMKLSFLFYDPVADLAELSRRVERLAVLGYLGIERSG